MAGTAVKWAVIWLCVCLAASSELSQDAKATDVPAAGNSSHRAKVKLLNGGVHVLKAVAAAEKTWKFFCYDSEDKPNVFRAWLAPRDDVDRYNRCEKVPNDASLKWIDLTDSVGESCRANRSEHSCYLDDDSLLGMDVRRLPNPHYWYWFVCYKCPFEVNLSVQIDVEDDKDDSAVVDSDDDDEIFLDTDAIRNTMSNASKTSLPERKQVASDFLERTFGQVKEKLFLEGRINKGSDRTQEATRQFLRVSDQAVGLLSIIVRANETLTLDVKDVGKVELVHRANLTDGQNVWHDHPNVVLPAQSALSGEKNSGSIHASIVTYTDDVLSLLRGPTSNVSEIVSVSVYDGLGNVQDALALQREVSLRLKHDPMDADDMASRCVFWDFATSSWSSEGCYAVGQDVASTLCRCNHLTNFAVILDIVPYSTRLAGLQRWLTLIGCSLSALGLAGTLVFFLRQRRESEYTDRIRINTHFCANLLLVQLLMLFGIGQTEIPFVCKLISILLHLSLLSTFFWSLLAAYHIYTLLVDVFETESSRHNVYYVIGYCAPLTMVLISIALDMVYFQDRTYGTDHYCWMIPNALFYALFLVPMAAILVANLSILSLVMAKVCMLKPRPFIFGQARGWLCLVLLLGGTWMLGLVGKFVFPGIVVAVGFNALNSLQGLLIFVFHVLFGQNFRRKMKRHMKLRSMTTTGTGGGSGAKLRKNSDNTTTTTNSTHYVKSLSTTSG